MKNKTLLHTGIVGTLITAVCCFTPALVMLLGVAGLSAALVWLDYVLLAALLLFLGITVYALLRRHGKAAEGRWKQTS